MAKIAYVISHLNACKKSAMCFVRVTYYKNLFCVGIAKRM